jgi:HPt (histidine-containing phosphotransfer) domain-containing protein|nr:Hpt domain-containing protein [Sphingomonas tagetis]
MAALRERFVAQALSHRETIAACTRDGSWAELSETCHVLAGGAGMFGFAALGDAARDVEEAIDNGLDEIQLRALAATLLDEANRLPEGLNSIRTRS